MKQALTPRAPARPAPGPGSGPGSYQRLQRQCAACKAADRPCTDCDKEKDKGRGVMARLEVGPSGDAFEQEADRVAAQVMRDTGPTSATASPVSVRRTPGTPLSSEPSGRDAPPIVDEVLRSPGERLDPSGRRFFEQRFGHDFSHVRVHRDAQAQRSAQAVAARAYSVGEHIVFNSGQYAPESGRGRELMAHELTHVLQQRGTLQRAALSPEFDDDDDRSPGGARLQRAPLSLQRDAFDDDYFDGGDWPEKVESRCIRNAAPDPVECDPAIPLTWADFSGTPPASSPFGAETASGLRERSIHSALLQCSRSAAGVVPGRGVQAFFDGASSWVKASAKNAGDPALNGCASTVTRCQQHFDTHTAAGHVDIDFSISPATGGRCAASIGPANTTVTSRDDCATTIEAACTAGKVAESARLLRHEQGHYDLACAMARKANAMLYSTPDFDNLLRGAKTALNKAQKLYDTQSNHGCIASSQATWEADIAAGLPAITITPEAARRRGRR